MPAFGLDPPQGDPSALAAAATSWRRLGAAFVNQGEAVTTAARVALDVGGWQGTASEAFVASAERLIKDFTTDAEACGQASAALNDLSHALQHAQQVAGQALGDCGRAQSAADGHQAAADQAGQAAANAQQAASAAVHPTTAAALQREADQALSRQGAAQNAAAQAQNELSAAQARGRQAVAAYEQEAQGIVTRLNAAGAELNRPTSVDHAWAISVFTWLGHINDFGGAGSTSWVEQYDAQLSIAERRMFEDITKVLGDPQAVNAILNGDPTPLIGAIASDPTWEVTANAASRAGNPLVRFLAAGPSEDAVGVLGKVPYLAYGMTAADMILNRNEGMGTGVVEPLGNLAVGTAITEGTTAALGAAAAGDGAIAALAGTLAIPGVGEFVLVGAAAVLGTYAVDKGAEWVWEHRAEIGHAISTGVTDIGHGLEDAGNALAGAGSSVVHTAGNVVHDLEPWNW